MEIIYEKAVFAPKGGKPGYIVNGKWYPVDSKDLGSEGLKTEIERYGRLRGTEQIQKDISSLKPKPAAQPPAATSTAPAQPKPEQQPPATTTPAPAATTQRPAEPKVSPSKPAQTGDRTKDLTTWATTPKNRVMINTVGTPQQKAILSAADKGTAMPAPRPISKDVDDIKKMQAASRERQGVKESYDAYDLVLEYLLSQGHTDTVEEAHYVMMEMDAETIGTIIEAAADQSDKQIDKGVKTTYKAQKVLDNQHQGRSKGLNKLPRGEREEKAKRMGGRLKSRRDDLFGERNKREDSKREQLKKMLGL